MLEVHTREPLDNHLASCWNVDASALHEDDENLPEFPKRKHKRNLASSSMRTMPRYFSTAKLIQKATSEKLVLSSSNKCRTTKTAHQSEEKLVEIFEADRKAGEFHELDPLKIFENEARLNDPSIFVLSSQSLQDLEASLNQLCLDDDALKHLESTAEEDEEKDDGGSTNNVRFGKIHVRKYPMVLGDSPGGFQGPPVSMGWQYFPFADLDIDKYELARHGFRRKSEEMRMTADHRLDLLKRTGFHLCAILTASKDAERVRRRRMSTLSKLDRMEREAFIESLWRKWKNWLSLGRIHREEKEYLSKYVESISSLPSRRHETGKCGIMKP